MIRRTVLAFLALACALTMLRQLVAPILVTNDGPQHLWASYAFVHALPGYEFTSPPTSNGAAQICAALLLLGLTPMDALAVASSLIAAAFATCFALMALSWSPRRWPIALLGIGLSQQLAMQAGTLPFMMATTAAFLSVAITMQTRDRPTATTTWLIQSLLLLATAWLHIVPAAAGGMILGACEISRSPKPMRVLMTSLACGMPAFSLVVMTALLGDSGASVQLAPSLLDLRGALLPQDPPAEGVVYLVAFLGIANALATRQANLVPLAMVCSFLIGVAIAVDDAAIGWNLMRERLLAIGLASMVASVPVERLTRPWRKLALAGAILWSSHVVTSTLVLDRKVAATMGPAIQGTGQLGPLAGRWAPVLTVVDGEEPRRGRLAAWIHVGQLMALNLKGQPAYSQDNSPGIHHLYRPETEPGGMTFAPSPVLWPQVWNAGPRNRRGFVSAYAAWGATVPRLVVYGPRKELDLFVERGHEIEAATPEDSLGRSIAVTRFIGCAVVGTLGVGLDGAKEVEVGFFPAAEAIKSFPASTVRQRVHLHGIPCGDGLWFRALGGSCGGARVSLPTVRHGVGVTLQCPTGT